MTNSSDSPFTMKVLHITETITGGIASYLEELAPLLLSQYGVSGVRFVIPQHSIGELPEVPAECIIPFTYTGRSPQGVLAYARQIARIIKREKPTIIHAHSTFAGFACRVLYIGRRRRPYIIYCAHGWSFLMDAPYWKRFIFAQVERFLARYTDILVNISRYELTKSVAWGVPAEKSHVVYHGIEANFAAQRTIQLPPDRINLLFVGRYDRPKGIDILLDAMKLVRGRPIHLHVIGGGVLDEYTPSEAPNVSFLGWLPRAELDSYYLAADAVVMPSRWEGFGYTAIEAMRCGTAVIASSNGALPEVVESGRTGLVYDENTPTRLAEILASLTREQLKGWGENGAERVRSLFSAERMGAETIALYRKIDARTTGPIGDRTSDTGRAPNFTS